MALGLLGISVATSLLVGISTQDGCPTCFPVPSSQVQPWLLGGRLDGLRNLGRRGGAGLASGNLNSCAQVGTTLGLAALAAIAAARTEAPTGGWEATAAALI